jgi:hypothetical protein
MRDDLAPIFASFSLRLVSDQRAMASANARAKQLFIHAPQRAQHFGQTAPIRPNRISATA